MSSLKLLNQDAEHAKRFVALAMNINAAKGLQVSLRRFVNFTFTYCPSFPDFVMRSIKPETLFSSDEYINWYFEGGAQVELGAERNIEDACWRLRRREVDERWQDSSA